MVLAYQRYGAGKAIAFPVQDSWQWQMHADIPLEDQTHETFWRRLLRWLVDGVPERLTVVGRPRARRARRPGAGDGECCATTGSSASTTPPCARR